LIRALATAPPTKPDAPVTSAFMGPLDMKR
jgi:hypothetical protein